MTLKGLVLLVAVAATVAALWPAAGSAANAQGVVVASQRGTLLVAAPSGKLSAVRGNASIGSRIALVRGRATVVGHAKTARIHGIVVRRIGSTMILSSNRHLVAIHKLRLLADATPTTPQPGAVVNTTVTTTNGELDEQDENEVGQVSASSLQVQAVVAAVGAGTITLTVQGQTLVVPLPAGLTFPASVVGQTVTVSLSLGDDNNDQGDDDSSGGGHDGGGGGDG